MKNGVGKIKITGIEGASTKLDCFANDFSSATQ
jgi:hypothetical protein